MLRVALICFFQATECLPPEPVTAGSVFRERCYGPGLSHLKAQALQHGRYMMNLALPVLWLVKLEARSVGIPW